LYCLLTGDTFLFTISDPKHYPTYLKDSVLNTNADFDYGAFLKLQSEMDGKRNSDPSLFAFTFAEQGTYVFTDSANAEKLMVITVMGPGESCADPDKYV
jgi:hypothetical protein